MRPFLCPTCTPEMTEQIGPNAPKRSGWRKRAFTCRDCGDSYGTFVTELVECPNCGHGDGVQRYWFRKRDAS